MTRVLGPKYARIIMIRGLSGRLGRRCLVQLRRKENRASCLVCVPVYCLPDRLLPGRVTIRTKRNTELEGPNE